MGGVDPRVDRGCRPARPRCARRGRAAHAAVSAARMRSASRCASSRSASGTSGESTGMPCTSRAKTRHCSGRSTWCQGVSVPPQSKTTASTGLAHERPISARISRHRRRRPPASRRSPERRSLSSTMPSARPRPTTTMVGTPISSASLNFTPGLTPGGGRRAAPSTPWASSARVSSSAVRGDRLVLAGGDDVHVGRGERAGPDQAELVVVALGDARDGARDTDAVGAHDHGAQLAVLVEHLEVERLGVLGAELEDVAHLDAAGRLQRRARTTGRRRRRAPRRPRWCRRR